MLRLTIPAIDQAEIDAVTDVLRSGYLVQGPKVAEFEEALAKLVGVRHAVAVSSGTAALHLALLALDIGPGDIVITTAYSWPATANVIELCGAETRFVDISLDDLNIDVVQLQAECERLQSNPSTRGRVKAIMPVHAFGMPANMTAIMEIANKYKLHVVEDAACALGASWAGKQCGSWGVLGCFSFHPRKAITTGEGGVVTTDDDSLADRLRTLRNHGLSPNAATPDFVEPGYNYRLTEIGAALGQSQLSKFDRLVRVRREKAACYDNLFRDTCITAPAELKLAKSVYQSYVIQLPVGANNSNVISALREQNIESTIGTYHIPRTSYYRRKYGFSLGEFPVADTVASSALTLPLHSQLADAEQCNVARSLLAIIESSAIKVQSC